MSRFYRIVPFWHGMRVKILDAWANGEQVVSIIISAEGIKYYQTQNILIADDAQEFTQAIIRVLHDEVLANELANHGRYTVGKYYNWRRIYKA